MNDLFENAQEELKKEKESSKHAIKSSAQTLLRLKTEAKQRKLQENDEEAQQTFDIDNWEIEYEED